LRTLYLSQRVKLHGTNQILRFLGLFSFRFVIFFNRLKNLTKDDGNVSASSSGCYNRKTINANSILLPLLFEPEQHGIMKMISSPIFLAANRSIHLVATKCNYNQHNDAFRSANCHGLSAPFFAARAALLS